MKTFASAPLRVKADCPCHSTRMLLLQFRDLAAAAPASAAGSSAWW